MEDYLDVSLSDVVSDDEYTKRKKWLFKENIRLQELQKSLEHQQSELEDERKVIDIQKELVEREKRQNDILKKQLSNQKHLFDQQWQILENETRRLAVDKEKFKRDKLMYRDEIYREARRKSVCTDNAKVFFKGVSNTESLKHRYKALLKIYHPDNADGDKDVLEAISDEYEKLRGKLH
jgi:hypothetical protein